MKGDKVRPGGGTPTEIYDGEIDAVQLPTRYSQSRIEGGIEWYTVDAGPLEQDLTEECSCARCGSSVEFKDCWECGGEGEIEEADTDNYSNEYVWRRCSQCNGSRGRWHCVSTPEYCHTYTIPGREGIESTALKSEAWYD